MSEMMDVAEQAAEQRKTKQKRKGIVCLLLVLFCSLIAIFLFLWRGQNPLSFPKSTEEEPWVGVENLPDWVDVQLIAVDGASRRGEKLLEVRDIAVHYVANPGSTAQANRNYFNSPDSTTSSHFIVGLEGEVILCVPLDEKSSATNERNLDTISIEVCHADESGVFSEGTMNSLIRLIAWLCQTYDRTEENVIRHYDVTGKLCPLYYVENPQAWQEVLNRVADAIKPPR